jgi:hypothetical protein
MRFAGALVTLLVTAVAAYGGVKFMDSVGPDISGSSASASGGDGGARVTNVEADSKESLVRAVNFGKVLSAIKEKYGAESKLVNLRLEPSRVDVQIPQGTNTVVAQYNAEGKQTASVTTDTDLSDNPNVASITRVPANAPQRIMKKVVKKTGLPITNLSYMVITTFGEGKVGWYVSLDKGEETTWTAELDGSKVRAQ